MFMFLNCMKLLSCIISVALLLLPTLAAAATISGTVYDFSFEIVKNTIVEINTEPRQMMVATDGKYSFSVPPGSYIISAQRGDLFAEDAIDIVQHGEFRFDIILLPDFEQEDWVIDNIEELGNDSGLSSFESEFSRNKSEYMVYILLGMIAISLNFIIVFRKKIKKKVLSIIKKKKNSPPYSESFADDDILSILKFIKSERGRTTQKEIRKNIPLSEAKISLLLSELENDGKIKRFKRGRTNVVILKH